MTQELRRCRRNLHDVPAGGGPCKECAYLRWRRWMESGGKEKMAERRRRKRKDPEYAAMLAEKARERINNATAKGQKRYGARNTRSYIAATKLFMKDFLECWVGSDNRGHQLTKEKLPMLHDLRERAMELKAVSVQRYKGASK